MCPGTKGIPACKAKCAGKSATDGVTYYAKFIKVFNSVTKSICILCKCRVLE